MFIFILLCVTSKGFMKTFKAVIKSSEAPQGSVKIKKLVYFFLFARDRDGKG